MVTVAVAMQVVWPEIRNADGWIRALTMRLLQCWSSFRINHDVPVDRQRGRRGGRRGGRRSGQRFRGGYGGGDEDVERGRKGRQN
jgi:hypothetical protein